MTVTQTITAIATGTALLLTQPAFAGGPVIEDDYEAEAQTHGKAGWIVPVAILLIIAAAASGGSKSGGSVCYGDDVPTPEPC